MMLPIRNLGAVGVIKDVPAHSLPPEAWSHAVNVRFDGDRVAKIYGYRDVYNITVSAGTATQAIAIEPWFVMPVPTDTDYYWIYAGQNRVHAALPSKNHNEITRYSTATASEILYSATPSIRWAGANLAGLPILTNGVDYPQVWPKELSRLKNLQWDASAGTTWATRTAGPITCQVLRAYMQYGVALNMTEDGSRYPRRVRWSHPASAFTEPTSWEDERADVDASYVDLEQTPDQLVDCATLRSANIIYKEESTWVMDWVGGQWVMDFRPLFNNSGIFARDCVTEFQGRHFVVTRGDVVVHDGQSIQSVVSRRWRRYLFNNIDGNYFENTFVVQNPTFHEIWICYPESGVAHPYWCNMALVWNWTANTWSQRSLPPTSFINQGIVQLPGESLQLTYETAPGTFRTTALTYGERAYQPAEPSLLLAAPADTASASSVSQLLRVDYADSTGGAQTGTHLEREALPVVNGQAVDANSIKYVRGVVLYVDGTPGATFDVYVGRQMSLSDPVTYSGPFSWVHGTTQRVNCSVTGRYISIKITSKTDVQWSLTGYDLDIDVVGRY